MLCRGSACHVVTVQWDSAVGAYRFENSSNRFVLIVLSSWIPSKFVLAPGQFLFADLDAFELPFVADWVSSE